MPSNKLISDEYLAIQKELHKDEGYATSATAWVKHVHKINPPAVLDYGCGKSFLRKGLRNLQYEGPVFEYDPAIEGRDELPDPCEFVFCGDVLEHIEPGYLDNVLDHLKTLLLHNGIFVVATRKAMRVLPDGRNAHLIVQDKEFWGPKIRERFNVIEEIVADGQIVYVLGRKNDKS